MLFKLTKTLNHFSNRKTSRKPGKKYTERNRVRCVFIVWIRFSFQTSNSIQTNGWRSGHCECLAFLNKLMYLFATDTFLPTALIREE